MKKLTEEQLANLSVEAETGEPLKPYTAPENPGISALTSINSSLQKQLDEAHSLVAALNKLIVVVSASAGTSKKETDLLQRILVEMARMFSERLAGLDTSSQRIANTGDQLIALLGKPLPVDRPVKVAKEWTMDVQRDGNGYIDKVQITEK